MKVLCIDPGEKRIGVAISDPSGSLARPLTILKHISLQKNAERIIQLATEHEAMFVIIGQALDRFGEPTFSGRRAARLAATLQSLAQIKIILWDESFSTINAQSIQNERGTRKTKQAGFIDDHAASVILQSYLDAQSDV